MSFKTSELHPESNIAVQDIYINSKAERSWQKIYSRVLAAWVIHLISGWITRVNCFLEINFTYSVLQRWLWKVLQLYTQKRRHRSAGFTWSLKRYSLTTAENRKIPHGITIAGLAFYAWGYCWKRVVTRVKKSQRIAKSYIEKTGMLRN